MDEKQPIDLMPHEWRSERPKPKEPIFGRGWPIGVAVLISIVVAATFSGSWALKGAGVVIGALAVAVLYQFL